MNGAAVSVCHHHGMADRIADGMQKFMLASAAPQPNQPGHETEQRHEPDRRQRRPAPQDQARVDRHILHHDIGHSASGQKGHEQHGGNAAAPAA